MINFLAASAHAATYYVSTTGSDSADGSQAHPWKTIAHAVATMSAGDTTYVASGTYNETADIIFKKSGTASAPIQLLAAPGAKPVINLANAGSNRQVIIQNPAKNAAGSTLPIGYIKIDGFEITGGTTGIHTFNAYNVTISHNWIHDNAGQGILGNGKDMFVDSNSISHNGRFVMCAAGAADPSGSGGVCNKDHGMYITGTNWTVTNNIIYDNLASGIQVAGYAWCADGSCYGEGAKTKYDPSYAGASGFVIANNTIAYQENGPGIILWQAAAQNNSIINNILYENGQRLGSGSPQGINFYGTSGGNTIDNNLFYASGSGATEAMGGKDGWEGTIKEQSGNINSNPNFVNAPATLASGSLDFHLQIGSPAIDAGIAIPGMSASNPTPDIGASDTSGFTHPVTGTSGGGASGGGAGAGAGGTGTGGGLSNCAR